MSQQLRLAADPSKVCYSFININPNSPPYAPQVQAIVPVVTPYIPYLCGLLINEIQAKAQVSALRVYMFNLCAPNQFGNQAFDEIAQTAIEVACYLVATQNMQVQQAVQTAATEIPTMLAAVNCRTYPELTQYLGDQNVINSVQAIIQKFDTLGREIQNWKASMQQQQFQVNSNVYQPPGQQNFGGGANFNNAVSTSGATFTAAVRPVVQNAAPAAAFTPTAFTPAAQTQQGYAMEQNDLVDPNGAVFQAADIHDWKPNLVKEPYFLAFDPKKVHAEFLIEADGTTTSNYREKNEEEMEYDRHAMPTTFGNKPAFLDIANATKTMAKIASGIKKLNKEVEEVAEGSTALTTFIAPDWQFELSETAAWLQANLVRLQQPVGEAGRPDVYRVYSRIADAVITLEDESPVVIQLAKSKTFVGLREKMQSLGGEITLELYNVINMRMTQLVNDKLALGCGLGRKQLQITNFCDDIGAVVDILSNDYGDVVRDAFLSGQMNDIAMALQTPASSTAEAKTDQILAGMNFPEDKRPHVTYVATNFSMTFLDCQSWEIDVQIGYDGMPARLEKVVAPIFYDLVKDAFDDAERFDSEDMKNLAIGRWLFRTRDGRYLEAVRGKLMENSYLITLIK